jgi:hypothetical protein
VVRPAGEGPELEADTEPMLMAVLVAGMQPGLGTKKGALHSVRNPSANQYNICKLTRSQIHWHTR